MNSKAADIEYWKKRWPVARNFICAVLASALSNFVLQFFLYPAIEDRMGAARYGEILVFITIANVCALSFGGAANAACLTSRSSYTAKTGDFFTILAGICAVVSVAAAILVRGYFTGPAEAVCVVLLIVLTTFQNYSFLEFQLRKDYTKYFLFTALIAGCQVACLPLFHQTGSWGVLLLPGIAAGLLYVWKTGRIYRHVTDHSANMGRAARDTLTLSGSYLLDYGAQNADRFLLLPLLGGTAVTYYYVASLFSKTLSMISGPVNNLILGYLSDKKNPLTRRRFGAIAVLLAAGALLFLGAVVWLGPWLLGLPFLYPDLVAAVRPYIFWASLAQLTLIASSTLITIDLLVAPHYMQMVLQGVYVVCYFALAIPATLHSGLHGFVLASCMAAVMRGILAFGIGWVCIGHNTERT